MLLAAGLSSRMGVSKPLLPWDGRTLVQYQVAQLQAAGASAVVVVTGFQGAAVAAVLRGSGAQLVHNPRFAAGRAGSVRAGALAVPDGAHALVLNVDQPRPAAISGAVIDAHRAAGAAITVPVYEGRRGHPALFAAALVPALRAVTDAQEGLRAVMRAHAHAVQEVAIADPRVVLDMNTPDAYRQARRAFGLGAG